MRFALIAIVAGAAALGACSNKPEYEFAPGACYFVATPDNAPPRLQKIADDQPQLEQCAARLEERCVFASCGWVDRTRRSRAPISGRFIFIDREGVKIGKSLTGSRFFSMARTGDGRLAIPGAIQRDETGRPVAVAADSAAK